MAHNDFHGGNIALDESKRLVGVFDFGECCINYRSNDFLKMYQAMGRDFAVAMVESYNRHSKVKVNQEVLDVHYLSLISLFKDCAEKPEYKDRADGLKKYVKECLERYKKDKLLMAKIKFAKGACLE